MEKDAKNIVIQGSTPAQPEVASHVVNKQYYSRAKSFWIKVFK
jgi:hypothetical protein